MGVLFVAVKCCVFAFNVFSLILGICIVSVNAIVLETATPNTNEHTYCIVGIILGAFVCMTTIFGCYGVVCESLGVSTIYAFFMLTLLLLQLLQMQAYKQHKFFANALDRLETAWDALDMQPEQMQNIESNYRCCGLYDAHDYQQRKLSIPMSCYANQNNTLPTFMYRRGCVAALQSAYQLTMQRERIFSWTLLITECAIFACACSLCLLLYQRYRARRHTQSPLDDYEERAAMPPPSPPAPPRLNHVNSRTHLLSN